MCTRSKDFWNFPEIVKARLHGFSVRGVLRFFGTVWSLISLHASARPVWDFSTPQLSKVQYGPENSYKRKEISVRVIVALFIRPIYRTQKTYWNGFFQTFFTTGEIFIYEVCVNIRPANYDHPEPKSKIQPVLKHLM